MHADSETEKDTCHCLFDYLGKHSGPWWRSALRLKEAADTLRSNRWPDKRKHHDKDAVKADFLIGPVYTLLMGMAVEAALKSLIVAKQPDLVGPQGVEKSLGHHRLRDLWDLAGLGRVRSHHRDSLLDRLEKSLVIFGRYPVSKKPHDMAQIRKSSFRGEVHFDHVAKLWACLEKYARKTVPELFDRITEDQRYPMPEETRQLPQHDGMRGD